MDQARDSRMRSTRRRDCEPPLPEPLAYFLTWPTYGTWLPGDERGWVEYRHGWQLPDPARKREAQARLTEDACLLDQDQRRLVELTIADHCRVRGWTLYTVNCRSNHVHVIVAGDREPKEIREQFKSLVHPPAQGVAAGTSPSTLRTGFLGRGDSPEMVG